MEPRDVFKLYFARLEEILDRLGSICYTGESMTGAQDVRLSEQKRLGFSEEKIMEDLGTPPPLYGTWWDTVTQVRSILDAYGLKLSNDADRKTFLRLIKSTLANQGFLTADSDLMDQEDTEVKINFSWSKTRPLFPLGKKLNLVTFQFMIRTGPKNFFVKKQTGMTGIDIYKITYFKLIN